MPESWEIFEERWGRLRARQKKCLARLVELVVLLVILLFAFFFIKETWSPTIGIVLGLLGLSLSLVMGISYVQILSNRSPLDEITKHSDLFGAELELVKEEVKNIKSCRALPELIREIGDTAKKEGPKVVQGVIAWIIFRFVFIVMFLTCILYGFEMIDSSTFSNHAPQDLWSHIYVIFVLISTFGGGGLEYVNKFASELYVSIVIISAFFYIFIILGYIIGASNGARQKVNSAIRDFVWDHAAAAGYFARLAPSKGSTDIKKRFMQLINTWL